MLKEVREKFLEYFKKNGHYTSESASLLPKNDNSILFVNSGMAPMKAYFLNEETPPSKRIANSQKCLRVGGKHNDLADIGYTKRHHTFFEMLGNFSFGDYFKKEAINFAWDFLINELKLEKTKLYITVHPEDKEALNYWKKLLSEEKITKLKSNIWTMGDVGPWGYCSEIFYDLEEGEGNLEEGDRYLEIWNLVFTEFCNDGKKNFKLDFPCIDTGIGLERIVSILEKKTDNYEIQFFKKPLKHLNVTNHNAHSKIFLDHLRSTSFLIMEGIVPGPSQEGYVLRRLIRRMLRSYLTFKQVNFSTVIKNIFEEWKDIYQFEEEKILRILEQEKQSFEKTINEALKHFEDMYKQSSELSAENIFLLHDRYGLTFDIVNDLLKERKGKGDFSGFERMMEEAKQKNGKEKLNLEDYQETQFQETFECEGILLGVYGKNLIFDKSVFYAEGGGQIGDTGEIIGETFKAKIVDTKKHNKVFCHEYELIEGTIGIGQNISQKVDKVRRRKIASHHSASHLLQYALEKIYGEGIQQMGSFVSDKKLREDFSFPGENIDLQKIEEEINKLIKDEVETEIIYTDLKTARQMGAKAFFDYEDQVRVVKVGPSMELCGGTHVKNTLEIMGCKLLKVVSVKSGVKRFEGIAGLAYIEYLKEKEALFDNGCEILQCTQEGYLNALKKATEEKVAAELKYNEEVNGTRIGLIKGSEEDKLEDLMNQYKLDVGCLYIEKELKSNIKIKITNKTLNAKELINGISSLFEAKGVGGNTEFAQTGGKKQENLELVFKKLVNIIRK